MQLHGYFYFNLLLCLVIVNIACNQPSNGNKRLNVAVIDRVQLFEEFQGKVERKIKLDNMLNQYNHLVDSLSMIALSCRSNLTRFQAMNEKIAQVKTEYLENRSKLVSEYDEQIWSQLSGYLKDYSREMNYDIMLSRGQDGSVLYCDSLFDVTTQFIKYANTRYEGN
jgi:outer membrane protein